MDKYTSQELFSVGTLTVTVTEDLSHFLLLSPYTHVMHIDRPIALCCWWISHLCNNQLITQQLTNHTCPVLCYRGLLWCRMPRLLLPLHSC